MGAMLRFVAHCSARGSESALVYNLSAARSEVLLVLVHLFIGVDVGQVWVCLAQCQSFGTLRQHVLWHLLPHERLRVLKVRSVLVPEGDTDAWMVETLLPDAHPGHCWDFLVTILKLVFRLIDSAKVWVIDCSHRAIAVYTALNTH